MSPLSHSLRWRLGTAAVAGAVLCVVLTWTGALASARWWTARQFEDLRTLAGAEALARCAANPQTWHFDRAVYTGWAYDPYGRSANPEAPPLPPDAKPVPLSHFSSLTLAVRETGVAATYSARPASLWLALATSSSRSADTCCSAA